MKIKFIVITLVAIFTTALAVGSYFGYQRYETSQLIAAITPHVKNASIRVQNSTRFETESDSKATFGEVFEILEIDIAEIEKHLIEVQTLTNPNTAVIAEPSVIYLKSSQEYLRALLHKFRSILKSSSATESAEEAIADLRSSSHYGFDYAKLRADKALKELEEANKDLQDSKPELAAAARKLILSSTALQGTLASDSLVPISQLQAVSDMNSETPEEGAIALAK